MGHVLSENKRAEKRFTEQMRLVEALVEALLQAKKDFLRAKRAKGQGTQAYVSALGSAERQMEKLKRQVVSGAPPTQLTQLTQLTTLNGAPPTTQAAEQLKLEDLQVVAEQLRGQLHQAEGERTMASRQELAAKRALGEAAAATGGGGGGGGGFGMEDLRHLRNREKTLARERGRRRCVACWLGSPNSPRARLPRHLLRLSGTVAVRVRVEIMGLIILS
eukprot:COSAG01_NODE_20711_length_939_cov_0.971429_1_plen_219_part_00